jgi:23S rRNA (cytosine1962-C5)-methyltransferase
MRPVILHRKHVRAVGRGHPWLYRQAVEERPRNLRPGSAVDVVGPDRSFIGKGIWEPRGSLAARMWTLRDDQPIDQDLFAQRFREARMLRKAAGVPDRTDAYRVVHAEGDRMPGVVVDRWGDWLTLTLQTPALEPWLDRLLAALVEAVPAEGIYVKDDERSVLMHGAPCPDEHVVSEPTCRARVFLEVPGKSGLFTDMRDIRVAVAPMLSGRRVLNLFAHTGAWSAAAAGCGAREIVSVDLSGPYLEVAEANVELTAPGYDAHTAVKQDVFEFLSYAEREGMEFDAIVIDPPTFSSSRTSGTFNVKDRYRPLVRAALRVLEPRGLLLCATNWRGISRNEFLHTLQDAARMDDQDLRVLAVHGQPADHPVVPAFPEAAHLHVALCATAVQPPIAWRP